MAFNCQEGWQRYPLLALPFVISTLAFQSVTVHTERSFGRTKFQGKEPLHRCASHRCQQTILYESSEFSGRMPNRYIVDSFLNQASTEEWGMHHEPGDLAFPSSAEELVDSAFAAIAGTLYDKQKLDPNIASNACSTSIFTQRPTRRNMDSGRIGVEVDGAEYLTFSGRSKVTPSDALHGVALRLAAKLSKNICWKDYSEEGPQHGYRPVALCFNTVKQALSATAQLQKLQEMERQNSPSEQTSFDHVRIQCLADDIPLEMKLDKSLRRRYGGLAKGFVNATRGIVVVVQPTDYNSENLPPGPAVGSVGDFQRLAAQTSIQELPTVVLSPRFLSNDGFVGSWDQSGYQKSATYGGAEPPKGPTPWIMRDFTPPVYCWVGSVVPMYKPPRPRPSEDICHSSRVAMTQSVMGSGHSWHLFLAEDCILAIGKRTTTYKYIASTKSASGRPTQNLIHSLMQESQQC